MRKTAKGALSAIASADQRQKRALRCPAKYQVIPNHSACLEKSSMASNSGVIDADKTTIVDSHNSYRAGVVPTAVLMYKMYWDDEIAMIAQNYADACRFSVGQNLAAGDYDVGWGNIVKLWYDEVKDFTMNGTNNFGRVGHYTQVVSANSILIGCGFALCGTTRNYVCNYGPAGNMDYNNPYLAGTACSGYCTGKVCLNGGTMDPSTCSCSCKTPATTYVGDTCQLNCSIHADNPGCTTFYSPSHCDQYVNVPEDCPALCNVCPCAGIDNIIGDACILGSLDNGGNRLEPFQQSLFQISALLYLFTVGFLQI
uniref:Cysteine-rich secretory protein Mr30 n=1 Tax=Magallana gigas TaxID=29159 RepID=K1QYI2_MAGGI